ncbi:hypothetical protein V9K67_15060 [Paraflavisolibacter sp. H34]|uniref:hypothetical protein n=1 Tax=Huijunlia imazamoxiresistens TaxID=3127457 RepID=UPI00301716F1
MKRFLFFIWLLLFAKTVADAVAVRTDETPNDNNVFIITLDGLRWQEVFTGADSLLLRRNPGEAAALRPLFWDARPERRRQKLMPFFWSRIAAHGLLLGNRRYGNRVDVANLYALSYPGYNELFTGRPDPAIWSNDRLLNQNVTVLEYLNDNAALAGKVAAFTSWNLFPYILNKKRSGLYIDVAPGPRPLASLLHLGDSLQRSASPDPSVRNDFLTYKAARAYILAHRPRVVHLGLGGTDLYGHLNRYGDYLRQIRLADNIIHWLWQLVESSSFYRGRTTFIITTDHGRGGEAHNWHEHGLLVKGSSQTWMALLGNGVPAHGEMRRPLQVYQKQVAGTIGYFLHLTSYNSLVLPLSLLAPVR